MSDRDPLHQLADFGTGGPVNPLPAAEVRRLGDRRRARRTAVSAVAGVTAVLAVAVPAALYAARDGGAKPPEVLETPTVTSIPDEFPLDRGAHDFGPDGDRQGPAAAVEVQHALPCDSEPIASAPETDRLAFVNAGGEFTDSRELLLFDDEATARGVLDETRRVVEGCDNDNAEGIRLTWRTENADTGQDSVTFVQGVPGETGGTTYQYTRVGAAILTVQWRSEGGGDVAEQTAISKAIVPDMCVFTAEGCPEDSPSPSSTPTVKEIAADFPLADGFPERSEYGEEGYTGPSRTLDPVAYDLCGQPLPDPAYRDRLLAGYQSAEDYRTRQLTTYADADAAVAASRAVIEAFGECTTEGPDADGYVSEREVRELTLGGESWAVLDRATMNGGETPFGSTLLVVRLGRAVLIEDHTGHAGYPTADGIQELSERLATPIEAMCAFTVAGCDEGSAESAAGNAAEETATASGAATDVVTIAPVAADGDVVEGWTVRAGSAGNAGDCYPSPAAPANDVFSCGATASGWTACWKETPTHALCLQGASRELVRVGVTTFHGGGSHPRVYHALEIVGGSRCVLRAGGAGGTQSQHPGWVAHYECAAGEAVWAAPGGSGVDTSQDTWTVQVGDASGPVRTAAVVRAWVLAVAGPDAP